MCCDFYCLGLVLEVYLWCQCLENLEMSWNWRAVREMSGSRQNVGGESCHRKLSISSFKFGASLLFTGLLQSLCRHCEGFFCLLSHFEHSAMMFVVHW